MLAPGHKQAAEDIETTLPLIQSVSSASRLVVEGTWGASFHWIAFGCETKYQRHQENHSRLGAFLRSLGAPLIADAWERLDQLRQRSWYGNPPDSKIVQASLDALQEIRQWATT